MTSWAELPQLHEVENSDESQGQRNIFRITIVAVAGVCRLKTEAQSASQALSCE